MANKITVEVVASPSTQGKKTKAKFTSNDPEQLAKYAQEDFVDFKEAVRNFSKTSHLPAPEFGSGLEEALIKKYTGKGNFGLKISFGEDSNILHGNKDNAADITSLFKTLTKNANDQLIVAQHRAKPDPEEITYIRKEMQVNLVADLHAMSKGLPLPKAVIVDPENLAKAEKEANKLPKYPMGQGKENHEITSGLNHNISRKPDHKTR
jgi:hypothetical protein